MIKQRTIRKAVTFKGIGLHTGLPVKLKISPLPSNSGIVYKRTDLDGDVLFYPSPKTVKGTSLCTQIFDNSNKHFISTVEHLNAAISACGIDNLLIEVDNVEIPIADGSSSVFMYLLQEAEIIEQNEPKSFLIIKKTVEIHLDDKFIKANPSKDFFVKFQIDFEYPYIKNTPPVWQGKITPKSFLQELSRARTFGFMKDIERLQQAGLCLGGSLDCAVVLDEFRVLNEGGLRYPDEFVRHKALDLIGDLFVVGKNIIGSFNAYKSGHELNNLMLIKLQEKDVCVETTLSEKEKAFLEFNIENIFGYNLGKIAIA